MGLGVGQRLKNIGVMTAAAMVSLIQPQVGREELADAIGYVTNAGVPSAVVPDFIGQKLFDTSNSVFYIAFGTAAGEWIPMGLSTLSAAELAFLDGALATNGVASKAAIIDSAGQLVLPGQTLATEAGTGITTGTGTVYKSSVIKAGGIYHTRIMLDLTGLTVEAVDGDIIGLANVDLDCHIGRITAARNGTILGGLMTCLEVPTTGSADIDMFAATEATGSEGDAISGLTETVVVTAGGAWTLGLAKALSAMPAANQYLYLTNGAGANAGLYDAGKFLIELFGYDA